MRSNMPQRPKQDPRDPISYRASEIMRRQRTAQAFKQSMVSPKLDITQSALSRIKTGKCPPTLAQWMKFGDLTGTETAILIIEKTE